MTESRSNFMRAAFLMMLALALGACDADTPTEPTQTPNPPISSAPSTGFAITVSANPRTFELGSLDPVAITVVARRTDTNQLVPRGSTALLSTTSGTLTNATGATGNTVAVTFDANGTALADLSGLEVSAVVRAQIEQSTGEVTVSVAEPPVELPFSVNFVNPNFGPPAGGTEVVIEGSGFSLPASVTFGGLFTEILSITDSSIRVRTPQIELASGQNRAVTVVVTINLGEVEQATDSLAGAFTYTRNQSALVPKIISVTPTAGPNEGGTEVTLFGEGFGSEVQVFFGAGSRTESRLLQVAPTRIVAETPPATGQNAGNRNSTVPVRVFDLRSGFEATLANAFQFGGGDMFISSVTPDEGVYFGGTLVTIFGSGFEAPVAVSFGGEDQQPVSVSGTEIVARSVGPIEINGCGRPSGAFQVTNIETNESFTSNLTFTYRPVEPILGAVVPSSLTANVDTGAILGSSEVTISGAGFDRQTNPPEVTFGGERSPSVSITSLDPNPFYGDNGVGDVLAVVVPSVQDNFPSEACTTGDGLNGTRFTERRVSVRVTNRDTGCFDEVDNAFTYVPNDTTCRATPVADFSFTVSGTEVSVRDLSTGSPTSIRWDFGDGTVENGTPGELRTHDYGVSGTFSVQLTATNDQGSNSTTKSVTIP